MQQEETKEIIRNSKVRDSSAKRVFGNAMLCAQFIRDYVKLPYMADVREEDIEDVSWQFVPLFEEERNADRVKKIRIQGEKTFFIISLIEHKTDVDFDVCMQIFRYMICIWEDYAKEEEKKQKGITHRKDFKYPPILPIVYYEGKRKWTAPLNFKNRIEHGEVYEKYIPDFQYYLVPIQKYSTEELLEKDDEMSLIMLINKIQDQRDMAELKKIAPQKLEEILRDTPETVLNVIAENLLTFLLKANVPEEEAQKYAGKVKEKRMAEMWEHAKINLNVELERKKTLEQQRRAEKQEKRAEEQQRRAEKQQKRAEKAEEALANVMDCLRDKLGMDEESLKQLLK